VTEVLGLTKRYGEQIAVDELWFTIRPGIVRRSFCVAVTGERGFDCSQLSGVRFSACGFSS
jgi:hypothetical protein